MNEMAYVLQAWLPLIVWRQTDAPRYQKGFITISVLSFVLILTAFTIRILWAREKRQKAGAKSDANSVDRGVDEVDIVIGRTGKVNEIDGRGSHSRDSTRFDEP
ncbi:hypothetical protein ACMFMF_006049 [Clarireedia jacksonii]